MLNLDLDKLADTPIPTDADVKRPFGLKADNRGVLVIPEAKLSAHTFTNLGKEVVPIGQLWLARLVPERNGHPAEKDHLKLMTVQHDGREVTLPLCMLGARRGSEGLELLLYGKGKQPLVVVPMTKATEEPAWPITAAAERDGEAAARLTLTFVGKHEASFRLTVPPDP